MTRRRPAPALVAAMAVALAAAAVTLVRLGQPDGIVFDETYYVGDARAMLRTGVEDSFAVHPPLGKWVIAAGIALLGDRPTGWRIGGALLSVLAVAATVEIGRRLTGRVWLGVVAGGLVLLDGVWLSLARIAMLDSVLAALVTLGTLTLVLDHQRPAAGRRWWLVAAGVAFGLGAATKWSGLLALAGAGMLASGWELARHRGTRHGDCLRGFAGVLVALVVVPVVVYAVSWTPWLAGYAASSTAAPLCAPDDAPDPTCDPPWSTRLAGLVEHHVDIATFHLGLEAEHPYRAPATAWPAQLRPVVAHYERCDATGDDTSGEPCLGPAGSSSEVAILGNPALWWSAMVLVPLSAAALRRRDGAAVVPLVMLGAQFLPWLVTARPVFNFYAGPLVPALALAVVVACAELDRPAWRAVTLTSGALAAVVAAGAFLVAGASVGAATTAFVLAGTVGVIAGSHLDGRRERDLGPPERVPATGTATSVLVLGAAVGLVVYLSPLWLALPVAEDTLRMRWWLRSWV